MLSTNPSTLAPKSSSDSLSFSESQSDGNSKLVSTDQVELTREEGLSASRSDDEPKVTLLFFGGKVTMLLSAHL